jgi:hypothetical protein
MVNSTKRNSSMFTNNSTHKAKQIHSASKSSFLTTFLFDNQSFS